MIGIVRLAYRPSLHKMRQLRRPTMTVESAGACLADQCQPESRVGLYFLDQPGCFLCKPFFGQKILGLLLSLFQDGDVAYYVCEFERVDARLPRSKQFALAADLEVLFGNAETVVRFFHYPQPL